VGRVLIVPRQNMSQFKVHVYSSFFMSRLHDKGTGGRGYNFEAVRNNDIRIEGGLGSLDELYIPTNVNNVHWNFIRVTITDTMIQLFDSQGVNGKNNKYLQATENYMYEVLTKDQRGERQDFKARKQDWSTTDQSGNSPRQGNGYNGGIFTLISMSLLQNGHRLRSDSYFQNTLYHRNSRKKLVWTIWKTGLGSNVIHWQPGT